MGLAQESNEAWKGCKVTKAPGRQRDENVIWACGGRNKLEGALDIS